MAYLGDLILETCNTPLAGSVVTLLGAPNGRKPFSSRFSNADPAFYIMHDGTNWEIGEGTYGSGPPSTITRPSSVLRNSAGTTSRISFPGLTNIYNDIPSDRSVFLDQSGKLASGGSSIRLARSVTTNLAANQAIANNTAQAIIWPTPLLDESGWWSASNPTRLTVPAGVDRVVVTFGGSFGASSVGTRQFYVLMNGTISNTGLPNYLYTNNGASLGVTGNGHSGTIAVVPGWYFELIAVQTCGQALFATSPGTWMSARSIP